MLKIESMSAMAFWAFVACLFVVVCAPGARAQNAALSGDVGMSVIAASDIGQVRLEYMADSADIPILDVSGGDDRSDMQTSYSIAHINPSQTREGDVVMMVMY